MNKNKLLVQEKIRDTLLTAATSFRKDQKEVFLQALSKENNPQSKWVLQNFLENSEVAQKNRTPLCDDTGIPHVFIEVGDNSFLSAELIDAVHDGIAEGLRALPGRPMAVKGNGKERVEQSCGLYSDPACLLPAPIQIRRIKGKGIRVYILMQGGGPEIRGKTFRLFHKHKLSVVINEIVEWATEGASKLGCTPCTPAIGIGRSHYEASSLMIEAMIKGNFMAQNDLENEITQKLNQSDIGTLGLGGGTTALATFLRIGEQRASGVRIVSLRLCCGVEPRVASCLL